MQQNSKCRLSGDRDEINKRIQQTSTKRIQGKTQLDWEGDLLGIVQKFEICPYYQIVYAQSRIRPGKRDAPDSLGFWDTNRSPNPG